MYLQQNIDCQVIIEKQDSILTICDSSKVDLLHKVKQAKIVIDSDGKEISQLREVNASEVSKTEKQRKKKVRWRNFGIGAIVKDLAVVAVIIFNPLKLIK